MTETIEGEVIDVTPAEIRAVAVVQQPGQSLVAHSEGGGPTAMVAVATQLANALKDIVEQRRLYAVISGKKYPQVEAWMTIARLDNVVAREARTPVRHDDGSYEAFAELVRLSDGMVIGASSALCGTPDDKPWGSRSEPARRSMAQTRAVSRAFRAQYSWIMALAGYEPTPAEEMPTSTPDSSPAPAPVAGPPPGDGGTDLEAANITGRVVSAGNGLDLSVRHPEGTSSIGFKLLEVEGHPHGRKTSGVRMIGSGAQVLADEIAKLPGGLVGERVHVIGRLHPESFEDKETGRTVNYFVVHADAIRHDGFAVMDTDAAAPEPPSAAELVNDLDALPW